MVINFFSDVYLGTCGKPKRYFQWTLDRAYRCRLDSSCMVPLGMLPMNIPHAFPILWAAISHFLKYTPHCCIKTCGFTFCPRCFFRNLPKRERWGFPLSVFLFSRWWSYSMPFCWAWRLTSQPSEVKMTCPRGLESPPGLRTTLFLGGRGGGGEGKTAGHCFLVGRWKTRLFTHMSSPKHQKKLIALKLGNVYRDRFVKVNTCLVVIFATETLAKLFALGCRGFWRGDAS